ncbi:hypothetical protein KVV02_003310 [Mortierella alpina]|uniref:Kazal-like domain-containing protein n=1 Tax=Mortierella alpina TaxID=64518 RepID=A0A9P7ZYP7_MORAP|nr:hypothetical protein KVV02_003310 [Mortierella alpina]
MQFSAIISLTVIASMAILSAMANPVPATVPSCLKPCNKMYAPVCGKLKNGETKTFGSSCTFDVWKCENPTSGAVFVANGECAKPTLVCNKACTKIYKPVCAKLQSGKTQTFANDCLLKVFNCENPMEKAKIVSNAVCPAAPAPVCQKVCPYNYTPVCVKLQSGKSKTFPNDCTLGVFKCENPAQTVEVVGQNACENL